jgi:hypothetical protein
MVGIAVPTIMVSSKLSGIREHDTQRPAQPG